MPRRHTLVAVAVSVSQPPRSTVRVPCSGLTEIFFSDRLADKRWAMRVCREMCPVRELCLSRALARREQYGVWGGRAFKTRRRSKPLDDSC